MESSDNTIANTSEPKKRKTPSTAWKKGQSGNPNGAPKRGLAWAELFTKFGAMDGATAAEYASGPLAAQLRQLPKGVQLKELIVLRALVTLANDSGGGSLLNALMDRTDGKVKDVVEQQGGLTIVLPDGKWKP